MLKALNAERDEAVADKLIEFIESNYAVVCYIEDFANQYVAEPDEPTPLPTELQSIIDNELTPLSPKLQSIVDRCHIFNSN